MSFDASKAFDRVRHDKLFECVRRRNISPLFIRIIANMYKLNSGRVIWNGYISEFYMKNGFKQNAVLNQFLFGIYLDFLLMEFNNYVTYALACADDLVLIEPNLQSIKTLLNIDLSLVLVLILTNHLFYVIFTILTLFRH